MKSLQVHEIPRAREVGQSWLTTPFTTLYAIFVSLTLVWITRPDLLLVNGPGTCVPIVIATRVLYFVCRLRSCKIVYIESICRVKSLSMSSKMLWKVGLLDELIVQWPELAVKHKGAKYIGKIL